MALASTTSNYSQHKNTRSFTTTSSNTKPEWFPTLDAVGPEISQHLNDTLAKEEEFKSLRSHVGLRTFVIRASPTPKLDSLFIQPIPVGLSVTIATERTFFSGLTPKQKHENLEDRSIVWLERMAKSGDRKRRPGSIPVGPPVVIHPKHMEKHAPLQLDLLAKASRGQFMLLNRKRDIRAPPYSRLTQPSAIWDELLADSGAVVVTVETFWLNLQLFKTHPDSPSSSTLALPAIRVAAIAPPRVLAKDGSGRIAFSLPLLGTLREFGLLSVGDRLSVGSDDADPVIVLPNDTLLGVRSGVVFEGIPNWFLTRMRQKGHVMSAARCKQILVFHMHADVLGHPSFVAPTLWDLCEAYRHLKKTATVPPKPLSRVFRRNLVRQVLSQAPSHQVTVQTLCFAPAFARGLALMQYKEVVKKIQASANISKGTAKGLQTRNSRSSSNSNSIHSRDTEEKNDQEDSEDNISIAAADETTSRSATSLQSTESVADPPAPLLDVDDFLEHDEDDVVQYPYYQSTSLPASPSFVPAGPSTSSTPLQSALPSPPSSSSSPPPTKRTRKHRVQLWPPRKYQQDDGEEEEALSHVSDDVVLSDSESLANTIEIRQQCRKRKSSDRIVEAEDAKTQTQSPAPKRRKYKRAKDIVPVTPSS